MPELIDQSFSDRFNYVVLEKVSGYPTVQKVGDDLGTKTIRLKFHHAYNQNPSNDFMALRTEALKGTAQTLVIANRDWGSHVITEITWSVTRTREDGEPFEIDASVSFMSSPLS